MGIILLVVSFIGMIMGEYFPIGSGWYLSPYSFYPASTTYVIGMIGFIMLAFWFLWRRFDRNDSYIPNRKGFINLYSKYSLTTYVVHHAVHIWPIYILAARTPNRDIWYFYQDAVSTPIALLLTFIYILGFYYVLKFIDAHKAFNLEGFLRKLSQS